MEIRGGHQSPSPSFLSLRSPHPSPSLSLPGVYARACGEDDLLRLVQTLVRVVGLSLVMEWTSDPCRRMGGATVH
ncbi:hypothetical protein NL676_030993 [Syzygium grande]|nr:hypothetical protein NL676_030993 [Syzygium grande]